MKPHAAKPIRRRTSEPKALTRSQVMALIRSCGNKATEVKLANLLRMYRVKGWRRQSTLPGKPDFVFSRQRLAVFVDGCFWHGHPTMCRLPATNRAYWLPKIQRNKARDRQVNRVLRRAGWHVLRIWEHHLAESPGRCVRRIKHKLGSNKSKEGWSKI